MKRKQLWRAGTAVLLASAMLMTSVPVTTQAEETSASIVETALADYDFADYAVSADGAKMTGSDVPEITLESVKSGVKPKLVEDATRGQVLSLTEQDYGNRAAAVLANPFAGKSVDNGFTVNFWTKTTGTAGGNRCLLDFEVAPATTGRAGTFAMNQVMVYWNTTDQNTKFTDFKIDNMKLSEKRWTMVTMTVTKTGIAFYRDGEKISHTITSGTEDYEQMIGDLAGTSGIAEPSKTNIRLGASLATYWHCAGALMDDVSFYGSALSAEDIAALYQETMVQVPLTSVTVSGESSVDEDKAIQLSVSLSPADATVDKTVTWKSSDENVLTVDENGKAFGVSRGKAQVTATVAGIESAPFEVTVNGVETQNSLENGYYLAVYTTTTPFYAEASNLAQETRSVYMAVSKDGKNFEVLNNGGGVVFAKSGTGQITDPRIYRESDDSFKIVAPDATASKGIHVFTSQDGVCYYDDNLVKADENTSLPLKKTAFKFLLEDENILETDTNITVGNALPISAEEYTHIVNKLGTVVNTGLESLSSLNVKTIDKVTEETLSKQYPSVNATYSDGSTQKFNIDWSGALNNIDLTKEGTYTVTGKVVQTKYLNNLKELNGSTLPEDDPANVGDEADNYDEETGTNYYDATKYVEGMADPCIYWDEQTGYYYMTGSYFPEAGDEIDAKDKCEQYDRVVLRRGRTLEELQDRSKQVTIWKVGNQGFDKDEIWQDSGYRYIWAPEIHRVGNNWVIYFTESHSSNAFNIYCHALVLDGSKDPYETALTSSGAASQWEDYKMRASEDDTSVENGKSIKPFAASFCLDMTYFEDAVNGNHYVIWAGKPLGNSDLFIAKVDPENPWQLTSNCIRLTTPQYGWEKIRYQVNEGPTVLQKDGKIFMCFSNSGTGSEYSIGMMTADAGTDLLDIRNWTKNPYPLLTSRDVDGEEGPGHNSFTVDQDGNAIFVYHARPTSHNYKHCGWDGTKSTYNGEPLNDPCRHARLKRVHWAADGTPILKMTYEEELTEANSTVSATIVVTKETEKEAEIKAAKEELTTTVTAIKSEVAGLKEADYTADTWKALQDAITAAEAVLASETADKKAIEDAKTEITAAKAALKTVEEAEKEAEEAEIKAAKEELTTTVTAIKTEVAGLNAADYTADTWKALQDAITAAEAVLASETADKEAIAAAKAAIAAAKAALKTVAEANAEAEAEAVKTAKAELTTMVAAVKAEVADLDAEDYTAESWKALQDTIAKAEALLADPNATSASIAVAKAELAATKAALVVDNTEDSDDEEEETVIKLNATNVVMGEKENVTLKATVTGFGEGEKVTWKSSKTSVAIISKSGKITAKKAGTTTITATADDVSVTCKVTVKAAPKKITLNAKRKSLKKGKTFQIKVKLPKNTASNKITYTSSKKSVATVSSTGKVTAKKKGKATITVKTFNGKKATLKITVK